MPRTPVCLIVQSGHNTFPNKYHADAASMLKMCRAYVRYPELYTQSSTIVAAFQHLHRLGEVELKVHMRDDGVPKTYDCDIMGNFIQPWPDEFFEIEFHLRFDTGSRGK